MIEMKKVSLKLEKRPDYRRMVKAINKHSKIAPFLKNWAARELFFEFDTEDQATVVSALLASIFQKHQIKYEFKTLS